MLLKLVSVLVVLSLVSGGDARACRGPRCRQHATGAAPGCRRRGGRVRGGNAEPEPEVEGSHYRWNMRGVDNDGLNITYQEAAFAPENSSTVYLYPMDRSQRAVGLLPSRITYDFSASPHMVAIRQGRFGRGPCILVDADVSTYDDMMNMLRYKNNTDSDVPGESGAVQLVASIVTDQSQVSQALIDICSKDKCGRPIQPVFYTTEPAEADDDSTADDDDAVDFVPDVVLLNTRISISNLPTPRGHGRRRGGAHDQGSRRKASRRQSRRQQRQQRRRNRHGDPQDADAVAGSEETPGEAAGAGRHNRRGHRHQHRRRGHQNGDASASAESEEMSPGVTGRQSRRWQRRMERRQNRRQQGRHGTVGN